MISKLLKLSFLTLAVISCSQAFASSSEPKCYDAKDYVTSSQDVGSGTAEHPYVLQADKCLRVDNPAQNSKDQIIYSFTLTSNNVPGIPITAISVKRGACSKTAPNSDDCILPQAKIAMSVVAKAVSEKGSTTEIQNCSGKVSHSSCLFISPQKGTIYTISLSGEAPSFDIAVKTKDSSETNFNSDF